MLARKSRYYAKRCLLSLLSRMAQHCCLVTDDTIRAVVNFLRETDLRGKNIIAQHHQPGLQNVRLHRANKFNKLDDLTGS